MPSAEHAVGVAALVVDELGAPEAGHAERQRMVVGQHALAHQRMRDRDAQMVDERRQLVGRVGEQDAAAGIDHRRLGAEQRADDRFGDRRRRSTASASCLRVRATAARTAPMSISIEKMSIGTDTSTGPGRPLSASWNALSMISGNRSARSTRQARFTNGR